MAKRRNEDVAPHPFISDDEEAFNLKMIDLVKDKPFIYDSRDPGHANHAKVNAAWIKIGGELNLDVEDAKLKWQRLRNNYCKALARRMRTPRSGSSATKLSRPWVYENEMEFLRPHIAYRMRKAQLMEPISFPMSPSLGQSATSSLDPGQTSENGSAHSDGDEASIADGDDVKLTFSGAFSDDRPVPAASTSVVRGQSHQTSEANDASEIDSAVVSILRDTMSKRGEDPAMGWFRSLLPMYNTLSAVEKLEFQSKVVLELRQFLVAKGLN